MGSGWSDAVRALRERVRGNDVVYVLIMSHAKSRAIMWRSSFNMVSLR